MGGSVRKAEELEGELSSGAWSCDSSGGVVLLLRSKRLPRDTIDPSPRRTKNESVEGFTDSITPVSFQSFEIGCCSKTGSPTCKTGSLEMCESGAGAGRESDGIEGKRWERWRRL